MIPEIWGGGNPRSRNIYADRRGILKDCKLCDVTEELNGEFTLKMEYPAQGYMADALRPMQVIKAQPNARDEEQYFRITKATVPEKGYITVQANHISYDLAYALVQPFSSNISPYAAISAISALENNILNSLGTLGFDITDYLSYEYGTSGTYGINTPRSLLSCLRGKEGSLIDIFGGEMQYRNKRVAIVKRRGIDTGIILFPESTGGKIVKTYTDNYYTHVYVYYTYTDENETMQTVDSGLIRINSVSLDTYNKTPVYERVYLLDASSNFSEVPTTAQLQAYATNYIKNHKLELTTTYAINSLTIPGVTENISLGDTVLLPAEGSQITTRVRRVVWDVLNERYKSITVGDVQETITDVIRKIRR